MSKITTNPTAELLRRLIRTTGPSVNAIAVGAGVPQPCLHRFVAREQGLTLRHADRLFVYFNLEVRKRNGGKGKRK